MGRQQLVQLQASAGNAAVAALLTDGQVPQMPPRVGTAAPPEPPARMTPNEAPHRAADGRTVVQRDFFDDALSTVGGGIESLRQSALGTVQSKAREVPGYELLGIAIGSDPITQQPVERTPTRVIGALVSLIPGGDEMRRHLVESGAIERAAAWFETEVARLGLTWEYVRGLFLRAWNAISATDFINPVGVWARLQGIFGPVLGRIVSFAASAGRKLMEFVFEAVLASHGGQQILGLFQRAQGVFTSIVNDPIGFIGNLVRAVQGGLGQFATNILTHLQSGLFAWLTGALRGAVSLPTRFDLGGILSFVANLLGLTREFVRRRLVGILGERVVAAVEQAVDWIAAFMNGGIGAIVNRLTDMVGNFVDMIIGGIRDWVARSVVGAAITRLISMFNPAGAVIQAIMAIYNTVQFFIERAQQLAAFATSVFDSIAEIASGRLSNAINAVEQALARSVPVVLGFLARLIGLGDIAAPVRNVIERARGVVDQVLDRVIGWITTAARRFMGRGAPGEGEQSAGTGGRAAGAGDDWSSLRKTFTAADGGHSIYWQGHGAGARLTVASTPTPVDGMLAEARRAITESHPQYSALQAATRKQAEIIEIKATVERSGQAGRQAADVDRLNAAMEELARLLVPLVPIVFPATAPTAEGILPAWVRPFELVKLNRENRVAQVQSIDTSSRPIPMVTYQIIRPRLVETDGFTAPSGGRTGAPEAVGPNHINAGWSEYVEDPRNYYMGPTPSKDGPVGRAVITRMRNEGKIVGDQVRYERDAAGNATPGRFTLYPISACAMGHIIDAVTWWNTNGRFTGPQSREVQQFMTDPGNYEIEPGGPNSLRGATLGGRGGRYLSSAR